MYKHITVKPMDAPLGAEISGVDMKNVSKEVADEILEAIAEHLVVVFRGQILTPGEHIAFGANFGYLHFHPLVGGLDGYPEILVFKKAAEEPFNWVNSMWHTDQAYNEKSAKYSFLYPTEIPSRGTGNTAVSNGYLAYEGLSQDMKDRCDTMKVMSTRTSSELGRVHNLVRVHPKTGKKCIYISNCHTTKVMDVSDEESERILQTIKSHVVKPEYTAEIEWELGTLTMLDLRCTQHYGKNDFPGEAREMHRVTIVDDEG